MQITSIRHETIKALNAVRPREEIGRLPARISSAFSQVGANLSEGALTAAFKTTNFQNKALFAGVLDIFHREFTGRVIDLNDETLPRLLNASESVFHTHFKLRAKLSDLTPLFAESYAGEQPFGESARSAIIPLYERPEWLDSARTFEPEIVVCDTAEGAAKEAAERLIEAAESKPWLVESFATGATQLVLSEHLRNRPGSKSVLANISATHLDEYVNIPNLHYMRASYAQWLMRELFGPLEIEDFHPLIHDADLPALEAERYENLIARLGGIDIQIFGIGRPEEPHIAFNGPFTSFTAPTRVVGISCDTRRKNSADFGGDPDQVTDFALTLGPGTIRNHVKRSLLIALGPEKKESVRKMLAGPDEAVSASSLLLKENVTIIVDRGAAPF